MAKSDYLYNYPMEQTSFTLNEIIAQIPPSALWIAFVVFMALSLVAALALIFHWNRYRLHSPALTRRGRPAVQIIYLVGLLVLFVLSGITLALFSIK